MKYNENFLNKFKFKTYNNCNLFNKYGNSFHVNNDNFSGIYWIYETKDFILDIHDFIINKNTIFDFSDISSNINLIFSYIFTATGQTFYPDEILTSHSLLIEKVNLKNPRFFLYAGHPYRAVSINFKPEMINKYINKYNIEFNNLFIYKKTGETKDIEKLVRDIYNCKYLTHASELFFEAKAKEWLSIILNFYLTENINILYDDYERIKMVAEYINKNYKYDFSQEDLENISLMSSTKLKRIFKQIYHMSITEYKQKQRIHAAEKLILTTDLELEEISKIVGYSSYSYFSTLYKRFNKITPYRAKCNLEELKIPK